MKGATLAQGSLPFLPYGRQCIDDDDVATVVDALKSDWLTTGPAVEAFEAELAKRVGAQYAVSCSSGTAALHLAALALGLGDGDRVAVPTMTFLATANAARYVGAEVAFTDVDPETGLMGADHLLDALGRHDDIKAVFPVHLNGPSVDMAAVSKIARARGLYIVEDGCHALGTPGVGACEHSDMTVFSFHPVKTVAMGEGGAITTNDETLYKRLKQFRSHGMVRDIESLSELDQALDGEGAVNPWYHEMHELGFNYRASDINCALGLSQLRKLDQFVARRQALLARYRELLVPLAPMVLPPVDADAAWHLCAVRIDFAKAGISRAAMMNELRNQGIGTQVHYLPVHRQPYYRQRYGELSLAGADTYYKRALSLPLFFDMIDGDVERVVTVISTILKQG